MGQSVCNQTKMKGYKATPEKIIITQDTRIRTLTYQEPSNKWVNRAICSLLHYHLQQVSEGSSFVRDDLITGPDEFLLRLLFARNSYMCYMKTTFLRCLYSRLMRCNAYLCGNGQRLPLSIDSWKVTALIFFASPNVQLIEDVC